MVKPLKPIDRMLAVGALPMNHIRSRAAMRSMSIIRVGNLQLLLLL